jgi:RNA polymerase sigma-70 factor, ECF subfamily
VAVSREALRFSDAVIEQLAGVEGPERDLTPARVSALRRCLEKLCEKDRILISLRYEPGATTQSVAHRSGRSLKGVYHSLNRIRMVLLECIQQTLTAEARSP